MAINCCDKLNVKNTPSTTKTTRSKSSNLSSCRVMKFDYTVGGSITSSNSPHDDSKKARKVSPYLTQDKVQLLSRVTEKHLVHKKKTDFISSFPLAVNIYKANSDEFKSTLKKKKVKKSVLTLPNKPAPLPQTCTVSDMNDSEYLNESEVKDERKSKPKKRRPIPNSRNCRNKSKEIKVYDRDAMYCSQLNIDLDSSSTEILNHFTGDGKKICKKRGYKTSSPNKAHDVWTLLRDMNRFPFRTSPPTSQDSKLSIKNNKNHNRFKDIKDAKFYESCRTEEFTYISSLVDKSPQNSQSSIDRITVIDKQNEVDKLREKLKVIKNNPPFNEKAYKQDQRKLKSNKTKLRLREKPNTKITPEEREEDKEIFINKDTKKLCNNTDDKQLFYTVDQGKEINNNCNNLILDASKTIIDGDDKYQNNSDKLSNEPHQELNGITKVVLNKGRNTITAIKNESMKRKTDIEAPKSILIPRLTEIEIRRRLGKIKYPLIILSKDQLSSTVCVRNSDPPQFEGLNEHIWPFMQNWVHNDAKETIPNYLRQKYNKSEESPLFIKTDYDNLKIINNDDLNKTIQKKSLMSNDKHFQTFPKVENKNLSTVSKEKPMRHFKDRMLHFLYKKTPCDGNFNKPKYISSHKGTSSPVSVATNTPNSSIYQKALEEITKNEEQLHTRTSINMKHPWAKKRWTSDFIDNVIKRLKNGVYYNHDDKTYTKCIPITKENSVQTEMALHKNILCGHCNGQKSSLQAVAKQSDLLESIPGFDHTLSDLEIETISRDQIAIKHCVTNVVVQFDVTLPFDISRILQSKKSLSCIPLTVTENQTRVFKSKTAIINAILPAELCSILPKMMQSFMDSRPTALKMIEKVESHLFPIAEIVPCDNDLLKYSIPQSINTSQKIVKGNFAKKLSGNVHEMTHNINLDFKHQQYALSEKDILPSTNAHLLLSSWNSPIQFSNFELQQNKKIILPVSKEIKKIKTFCSALQCYSLSSKRVVPAYKRFSVYSIAENLINNRNFYLNINMPLMCVFSAVINNNAIIVNVSLNFGLPTEFIIKKREMPYINRVDAYCKDFKNYKNFENGIDNSLLLNNHKANNLKKNIHQAHNMEKRKRDVEYSVNSTRYKRRHYVRLYKKCKSMSSISTERSSTALNKINSLDDFFAALGSAKTLSNVFDTTVERKILSSLKEMKNWITDITPRQTLLILLLANKKDTSNLIRYRPVILQGIAVNRITQASELDMEIEVIERENLQTFSRYEGISYVPASIQNQDSLLEELCWIAKTTASDYQKHYDESSERLLKSLLAKRKKLNPSYLRVMARYVGLGLLKSSK